MYKPTFQYDDKAKVQQLFAISSGQGSAKVQVEVQVYYRFNWLSYCNFGITKHIGLTNQI